jgi:hypothetical protein
VCHGGSEKTGEERHSESRLIFANCCKATATHYYCYNTPDGTCVRDYIQVAVFGEARVPALEALEQADTGIRRVFWQMPRTRRTSLGTIAYDRGDADTYFWRSRVP